MVSKYSNIREAYQHMLTIKHQTAYVLTTACKYSFGKSGGKRLNLMKCQSEFSQAGCHSSGQQSISHLLGVHSILGVPQGVCLCWLSHATKPDQVLLPKHHLLLLPGLPQNKKKPADFADHHGCAVEKHQRQLVSIPSIYWTNECRLSLELST